MAPVREKGIVHNKRYYTNETAEKENWFTYAKNYSRRIGCLRKKRKAKKKMKNNKTTDSLEVKIFYDDSYPNEIYFMDIDKNMLTFRLAEADSLTLGTMSSAELTYYDQRVQSIYSLQDALFNQETGRFLKHIETMIEQEKKLTGKKILDSPKLSAKSIKLNAKGEISIERQEIDELWHPRKAAFSQENYASLLSQLEPQKEEVDK